MKPQTLLLASLAGLASSASIQKRSSSSSSWPGAVREFFTAVSGELREWKRNDDDHEPTCDFSQNARLPKSGLPPPSSGLVLYHVAVGRGTQVSSSLPFLLFPPPLDQEKQGTKTNMWTAELHMWLRPFPTTGPNRCNSIALQCLLPLNHPPQTPRPPYPRRPRLPYPAFHLQTNLPRQPPTLRPTLLPRPQNASLQPAHTQPQLRHLVWQKNRKRYCPGYWRYQYWSQGGSRGAVVETTGVGCWCAGKWCATGRYASGGEGNLSGQYSWWLCTSDLRRETRRRVWDWLCCRVLVLWFCTRICNSNFTCTCTITGTLGMCMRTRDGLWRIPVHSGAHVLYKSCSCHVILYLWGAINFRGIETYERPDSSHLFINLCMIWSINKYHQIPITWMNGF